MAKITYTRTIYHYRFTPPADISRLEYDSYRQMLLTDPNATIVKKTDVRKRNNSVYVILFIGALCFIIGLMACLGAEDSSKAPGWGIFMVFGSLLFILFPIISGGRLSSAINEDEADNKRNQFFEELATLIRSCNSYEVFIAMYNQLYSRYR